MQHVFCYFETPCAKYHYYKWKLLISNRAEQTNCLIFTFQKLRMMLLDILIFVGVTSGSKIPSFTEGSDSCQAAIEYGVNLTKFSDSVAHNAHSITVEDIRYFFEEDFPCGEQYPYGQHRSWRRTCFEASSIPSIRIQVSSRRAYFLSIAKEWHSILAGME